MAADVGAAGVGVRAGEGQGATAAHVDIVTSVAGSVVADDAAQGLVGGAGVGEVRALVHRDVAGVGAAAKLTGTTDDQLGLIV